MRQEKNAFYSERIASSFTFHTTVKRANITHQFCFLDGSGPCLLGDCPLRAESRANLTPEISFGKVADEER